MNRRNYYTGKLVDTSLMEDIQNIIEDSILTLNKTLGSGIYFGGSVTQIPLTNSFKIEETICFDDNGNRIIIPSGNLATISLSTNDKKWASIIATFSRRNYQVEKDYYNQNQYFKLDDFSTISVLYSEEGTIPTKPSLSSSQVLLTDVLMNTSGVELVDTSRVPDNTYSVYSHILSKNNPHEVGLSQLSNFNANNNIISNVSNGSLNTDLVNKGYVDSAISGISSITIENLQVGDNTISSVSRAGKSFSEWKYSIYMGNDIRIGTITSSLFGDFNHTETQTSYTQNTINISFNTNITPSELELIVNIPPEYGSGWNIVFLVSSM